jgi:hypothetical protein
LPYWKPGKAGTYTQVIGDREILYSGKLLV